MVGNPTLGTLCAGVVLWPACAVNTTLTKPATAVATTKCTTCQAAGMSSNLSNLNNLSLSWRIQRCNSSWTGWHKIMERNRCDSSRRLMRRQQLNQTQLQTTPSTLMD